MDLSLLHFFNRSIANPLLDVLMVVITTAGLAAIPLVGMVWLRNDQQRQLGRAVLATQVFGLIATLVFYYLALRPRPLDVRLLLPMPPFPSFPSGHTVAACAAAMLLLLSRPTLRWRLIAVACATLIPLSRLYLGHHYPTDVLGGAVLGAAIGAACYGLFLAEGERLQRWRWLLWPQVAIAFLITEMAYLNLKPVHLLRWPLADKTLHFLLFGAIVFWLNLWLAGRRVQVGRSSLPIAILLAFAIAFGEEMMQAFSPYRTLDGLDLTADLLGMICFWFCSQRLKARQSGS